MWHGLHALKSGETDGLKSQSYRDGDVLHLAGRSSFWLGT